MQAAGLARRALNILPLDVLASKDFLTRQYVALSRSSNWQNRRRPLTPLLRAAYLILESDTAKMILFYFVALNTPLSAPNWAFFFFPFPRYFTPSPERKMPEVFLLDPLSATYLV